MQGVDVYRLQFVCLFVFCVFVRLRISLARTKLVAPRQGISRFGELSSQKLPQKPNIGRIGTRWQVLPIDASPLHWRRASSARPQYLRIFDRPRRRTYLCILMIKMVRFACCRLQSVGTALTDSAHQSISGQKQSAKVEPGSVHLSCCYLIDMYMYLPSVLWQDFDWHLWTSVVTYKLR